MKIIPLGDKIVVKRMDAEEMTAGGILLPDAAQEKPQEGRVLSIGEGRVNQAGERMALQVQEGDRIIFSSYAGSQVTVDNEELIIMSEDDVLAILG